MALFVLELSNFGLELSDFGVLASACFSLSPLSVATSTVASNVESPLAVTSFLFVDVDISAVG
jgi:hypothetical protein